MQTIFDKTKFKSNHYEVNKLEIPISIKSDLIPKEFLDDENLNLPDLSEVEIARHYTNLSQLNFGVDNGMYPLGSCTMKYNPKINERIATSDEFIFSHPLCNYNCSQANLKLMHDLAEYLSAITGMDKFSLLPAAGSHGELSGVMIIKKYFETALEERKVILIPDSAHGTNPASVAMCGFDVKEVRSTAEGNTDLAALKELLDENVAAMMLTAPNTLGLFDNNLLEVAELLHANGSLFYCDGANLNAVMGKIKITEMGFDIMHVNLHKTFSTPHGGGGPGAGPIGVVKKLAKFLPVPEISYEDGQYILNYKKDDSIGRIHSFYGNFLVLVKAYIYIRLLGASGLENVSEAAVLNANYMKEKLKKDFNLPIDRRCMHEFVLNDKDLPNNLTTNDIAKRLLDFGYHAPTIYFPLLIKGAMMFEPTESENKESLDKFIKTLLKIKKEAYEEPEKLRNAPFVKGIARVDVVTAARKPVIKWDDTKKKLECIK